MKNTIIVNLFSQEHVDKSIISSYILTQLKIMNICCEVVSIWTKGLRDDDKTYENPFYLVGSQSYILSKLYGEVDIIINEFPILDFVSKIDDRTCLKFSILEDFISYGNNNLNIYLNSYNDDDEIKMNTLKVYDDMCDNMGIDRLQFIDMDASIEGCGNIVELITGVLKYIDN